MEKPETPHSTQRSKQRYLRGQAQGFQRTDATGPIQSWDPPLSLGRLIPRGTQKLSAPHTNYYTTNLYLILSYRMLHRLLMPFAGEYGSGSFNLSATVI